jgi:hypothetical protein
MRRLVRLAILVVLFAPALPGCGGGAIEEGVPENVDMNKHYEPAAATNFSNMNPGAARKAEKAAAPAAPDAK